MEIVIASVIIAVVVGALVLGGIGLSKAKKVVDPYIDLAREKDDYGVIDYFGGLGAELMEERFKEADGYEKFDQALAWVSDRLEEKGIPASEELIRASVQRGYNLYVKTTGNDPVQEVKDFLFDEEEDAVVPEDTDADNIVLPVEDTDK